MRRQAANGAERKKTMRRMAGYAAAVLAAALLLGGCGQPAEQEGVRLDPKHPVNITVWHYYNSAQQVAFDELVERFNATEGAERGIFVEAHSQGNVTDLEGKVLDAFNKVVGSEAPPDIFSSYADTAYAIEKMGYLVDLEQYMTEEELAGYVDSFVEEGRIGENGELRIFPTAKSSEIFMLNKTAWDAFSAATGAQLDQLETREGLAATAQQYYEWTDGLTPDTANDGKAFYGRDAMANLFIIGSQELGAELLHVEGQQVELQVDTEVMRRLWDFYYVPYVNGWYSAYGRFRADDVKLGEIVAYTGSTASALYFPDEVETVNGAQQVDYLVLPDPAFQGAKPCAVQQGAGMVVTKSTPEREYAAVEFLKWFTQKTNNVAFACTAGYLPVKKEALDRQVLDSMIAENDLEVTDKTYDSLVTCFELAKTRELYTSKAFDNGAAVRKVLEYNLADKAAADRELVKQRLAGGQGLAEATADLTSEAAFSEWLGQFEAALHEAAGK